MNNKIETTNMSNKRKFPLDENNETARIYVSKTHVIDGPFLDLLNGSYYSIATKENTPDDETARIYVNETHEINGPFLDRFGKSYHVLIAKK